MRKFFLFLTALFLLLFFVLLYNTFTLESKQLRVSQEETLSIEMDSGAIQRLSRGIQFKTISFDEIEKNDYTPFDSLHRFIEASFPLVHTRLIKEVVNGYSLLYTWKGKNEDLKPVILYAHLDVVPVEDINLSEWEVLPFSGAIKDGYIWGRGTLDDKGSAFAILEAVEKLLIEGFTPPRTIYIAFGHDEEIGGSQGAKKIASLLMERNVKTEFHLDEGGLVSHGMIPGVSEDFALIGTGEKGYLTLELSVKMKSGHSSRPPKQTALGTLITALAKLEAYTFERGISITMNDFIDFVGPEMKMPLKVIFANKWLFKSVIMNEYQKSIEGNAMIRTTGVPTVFHAGVKENVVPGEAKAKVNFRILPGETCDDVMRKVKEIIKNDTVEIRPFGEKFEPSRNADVNGEGFKTIQRTIAKVFPDVKVAPFMMLGSTDSKHFGKISENVYRFLPVRMDKEEIAKIHGVNERIALTAYMESIAFYKTFISELK